MNDNKLDVKLTDVPETLLISTRARYLESKRPDGIINDPKTVQIIDSINHDFSGKKEVSYASQVGVAIRTEILDEQTNIFIKKHPDCTVVNLGCGLDTRFYRLDNGQIRWYDLDVPETISIRKRFFNESERYHLIAKSVLDFSWVDLIPTDKPILFLAEGLLMYFVEEDVKKIFKTIADIFPHSEMLLEAMSPFLAKNSDKHPDVKKYTATFKWGISTGRKIDSWNVGLKFVDEWYYFDRHRDRLSPFFKIMSIFPAFRKTMKIIHLRTS